jgi:S1-C subfamily serine protease
VKGRDLMFKDVTPDKWYYSLISRFLKMKAVSGYEDGTFKPDEKITRAETLSFIEKYRTRSAELVKGLLPSVITIKGKRADGSGAMGSGVVLDKQGFIATNCHVAMDGLDPWQSLEVFMDNVPVGLPAKVVYGDLAQDVAIIKIKADVRLLNPVTLAEKVELLDEIYCIGNPLGYIDTATKGVVSCVRRVIGSTEWIQTDAAINPGNSGGGAFNFLGELIGLPTWVVLWADEGRTIPINNVGFIAPFNKVQEVYQKALAGNAGLIGERINFNIM